MEYDVIVAGAGIAGLYTARELSSKGLKTLVVDSSKHPGDPNFSTAGTPVDVIHKFKLNPEGIADEINKMYCGTLSTEKVWEYDRVVSYTLNFRKMKQILADEVVQQGGSVRWDTKVRGALKDGDKISGVKTSVESINSKYVIDATGTSGVLLSELGLRKKIPCRPSTGIEIIAKDLNGSLNKYKNAFAIYFDINVVPHGYAWVFSNGNGTYKIGVGEYREKPSRKLPSLGERLEKFVDFVTNESDIEILEEHGNSIFVTNSIKKVRYKNLLGIGDTISAINPILGEGIRHSLYSASFAVEAIMENSASGESLSVYEKSLKQYFGYKWAVSAILASALYKNNSKMTQSTYEEFVTLLEDFSNEEVLALSFDYSFGTVLKRFPKNIPLLSKLLLSSLLHII